MTDFWARKLAGSSAPPAAPTAPPQGGLTPAGTPWWNAPVYGQAPPAQQPQAPPQEQPLVVREYVTAKAPSSKVDTRCPSCGGNNYGKPNDFTQAHCFECGYQLRGHQSLSGVAVVSDRSSTTKPSIKQVLGDGYHPDRIVAHGM